jgi:predicted  nucleic acid-binding Zn-ribbon protein
MRWKLKGFLPGVEGMSRAIMRPEVVLAEDYDAAQSELAALREELAKYEQRDADLVKAMTAADERLTAAEQRNAELVELLRDIYNQNELSGFDDRRILAVIDPQPTESGASE